MVADNPGPWPLSQSKAQLHIKEGTGVSRNMEAFQFLMFMVFIFPIIIIVIRNRYRAGKRYERWVQQYEGLGALPGWEVPNKKDYGPLVYQVDHEGIDLAVNWFKHGETFYLRVHSQLESNKELAVDVQSNFGFLSRIVGPDEQLGDEAFDAAVEIEGDEVAVTAMMTSRARAVMQQAVEDGVTIKEGGLELFEESAFNVLDEAQDLVVRVGRAALALSAGGHNQLERLQQNLANEVLPAVRARNLGMMLLHFPDEPLTKTSLSQELLRLGLPPGGEEPMSFEQEQQLILALTGPGDAAVAAIRVLQDLGSLPSLVALRAFAVQPEKDYRWRLSHQAMTAIQDRVGTLAGGGLSVAEGPIGGLSDAPDTVAAVSVVESPETT